LLALHLPFGFISSGMPTGNLFLIASNIGRNLVFR
jgi:hypothetical protein